MCHKFIEVCHRLYDNGLAANARKTGSLHRKWQTLFLKCYRHFYADVLKEVWMARFRFRDAMGAMHGCMTQQATTEPVRPQRACPSQHGTPEGSTPAVVYYCRRRFLLAGPDRAERKGASGERDGAADAQEPARATGRAAGGELCFTWAAPHVTVCLHVAFPCALQHAHVMAEGIELTRACLLVRAAPRRWPSCCRRAWAGCWDGRWWWQRRAWCRPAPTARRRGHYWRPCGRRGGLRPLPLLPSSSARCVLQGRVTHV